MEGDAALNTINRPLLISGLLIAPWLFIGVWLTGLAYPAYSHLQQGMSLLGAVDAPTHTLYPWLNNFPLAALFILFALGIAHRWRGAYLAQSSALLMVLHGVGSVGTGLYACDSGCAPAEPSLSQLAHNLSGLLMFLSLTLASALWTGISLRMGERRFAMFSLCCTVLAVLTVVLMVQAIGTGQLFGLFQRMNYGVSAIWIAGLALLSLRRASRSGHRPTFT